MTAIDSIASIEFRNPATIAQSLVRRFSFNETSGTTFADAMGGASAMLVDQSGAVVNSSLNGSAVRLNGGSRDASDYISLPNDLLAGRTDATIEIWATRQSVQAWSRIFDFGLDPSSFFAATWALDAAPQSARVEWKGSLGSNLSDTLLNNMANGVESHFAFVIDQGGGASGSTKVTVIEMAHLRDHLTLPYSLSQLSQNNNWLGRSKFPDNTADASYNEFRLYNRVLTSGEIADSFVAGPDVAFTVPSNPISIQTVGAGDVNGDGLEDLLLGSPNASVQVHSVNPAVSTASSVPNFSAGQTSTLQISLNSLTVQYLIRVETKTGSVLTNTINEINRQIDLSSLRGQVLARPNSDNTRVEIVSVRGGSDVKLTVVETVNGLATNLQIGFAPTITTAPILQETGLSVPIGPDAGSQVRRSLPVSLSGQILDVNVTLNITHTYDADLSAYLIGPDGTRVELFYRVGGAGWDFGGKTNPFGNTILDDQAPQSISLGSAPFKGTYRPTGSLGSFGGKSPSGTWTLEVNDLASIDGGTLNSWGITITTINNVSVSGTETLLPTLSQSVPIISQLQQIGGGNNLRITVQTNNFQSFDPVALGDLNKDGLADVGFIGPNGLQVYHGSTTISSIFQTPDLTIWGSDLSATAGDYNGNGLNDISLTGRIPTSIPLGNLFDDAKTATIPAALFTDTFNAAADTSDLGVARVQGGGPANFSINGSVNFDFTNLGWANNSYGTAANDATFNNSNDPAATRGIQTRGKTDSGRCGNRRRHWLACQSSCNI